MIENSKDLIKIFTDAFIAILSAAVPFLALKLTAKIKKKRKEWFERTHNNQWNRQVFESIVELRTKTNADRSYVAMRSNGTSYYNGQKGDHLTMVYESLEKGVSGLLTETQKIPVHFYEDTIQIADKQGFVRINTDELTEGSAFRAIIEQHGTEVMAMAPMRVCSNSIPEGYIGLCFLDKENAPSDEELAHLLKEYAGQIGLTLRVKK